MNEEEDVRLFGLLKQGPTSVLWIPANEQRELAVGPKCTWIKALKKNRIVITLTEQMALNRARWTKRINEADPKDLGKRL